MWIFASAYKLSNRLIERFLYTYYTISIVFKPIPPLPYMIVGGKLDSVFHFSEIYDMMKDGFFISFIRNDHIRKFMVNPVTVFTAKSTYSDADILSARQFNTPFSTTYTDEVIAAVWAFVMFIRDYAAVFDSVL